MYIYALRILTKQPLLCWRINISVNEAVKHKLNGLDGQSVYAKGNEDEHWLRQKGMETRFL